MSHTSEHYLFETLRSVTTDSLAPGAYMKLGIAEIARHCLESVEPSFAATVSRGAFVVGLRNFGAGSPLKFARGVNGLLGRGGFMYALPMR